ncbi:hypothetical protein STA3757_35390 [Stanieria sp. NIES-3757]|nr:hypothetical protein STA3757_35390 [Stanieria sp. NIES-3757]
MQNNNRKNSNIYSTTNILANHTITYGFKIDLDDPDVIAVDLLAQKEYEGREIPPFEDDEDFLYIETSKNLVDNNKKQKEYLPCENDIEIEEDLRLNLRKR